MKYRNMTVKDAADYVIMEKLKQQGGGGGLIAVDKDGNIAMPFNTAMMFRGYVRDGGSPLIEIY